MSARLVGAVSCFAIIAAGCGGSDGDGSSSSPTSSATTSGTTRSSVPSPGVWSGRADFGTFELTVNATSSAVSRIAFRFESWKCGSVTYSGGVAVSTSSGWPINSNELSLPTTISSNLSMSVQGRFTSATTASGTWSANSAGTTCTGTWTASM